jgi:uncharacterized protein (TIRG00374 family)
MRAHKILFLVLGAALFAWLLTRVELGAVAREIGAVGLFGFSLFLFIYALEFLCDVLAWQLVIGGVGGATWTARLYAVRAVGEAYNVVTPFGGMGGEPVKALILKRRYAVPYSRSGASLVLAKTANVLALLAFLGVGFALLAGDPRIGAELQLLAGLGLGALGLGIGGFFLVQRLRLASRLGRRFALTRALQGLHEFDRHLVAFYTERPARFAAVLGLGFGNWVLGALGVWVSMRFMARPVDFLDAWIIEAMAQMVRAAAFFIPAGLGAQEGVIMLAVGAVSGDATSGLAVALIRRAREIVWVLAGLAAGVPLLGADPRRGPLRDAE